MAAAAAAAEKPVAVRRAEELVEREMAGRDASHDAAHALRVRDLALSLGAEEGLTAPARLLTVTNHLPLLRLPFVARPSLPLCSRRFYPIF
jgi:hypothetical protein